MPQQGTPAVVTSILLTDAGQRATLAAARSLVHAGYDVHVTAANRFSLAGASRGVRFHRVAVEPLAEPERYATAVGEIATRVGAAVVLPVTDPSVEALLEHRACLPADARIPLPTLPTYRLASDKVALLGLAERAGFAVPASVIVQRKGDPGPRIPASWFPAVVKPHRSVVQDGQRRDKVGVSFVADRMSCERVLAALPAAAFPVLLQRRVAGSGEGLFVLRWHGRVVAVFAHRRLREKPPAGGVSVYRESIAPPPDLVKAGLQLLDSLDWNGVVMIECRRDAVTGRHVIMEVNGRLWGSLQLAIDAGVDFPTLLVRCALGDAAPAPAGYEVGVRTRWFWGDVDHLYLRLRRSAAELQLEPSAPSRWEAVRRFLSFRPGRDRCEVWRWRDPLPFLVETLQWAGLWR